VPRPVILGSISYLPVTILLSLAFCCTLVEGSSYRRTIVIVQENGSYQQRVLAEYIREIETRAETLIAAFQSSPPTS